MTNQLTVYNRPTKPGIYRAEIVFTQPIPFQQLVSQIGQMGKNFSIGYGMSYQIGAFGVPDATGKIRYLDSSLPLYEWEWPGGSRYYPGAAIARVTVPPAGQAGIPYAHSMIVYITVNQAAPLSPDGRNPLMTVIDKNSRSLLSEMSEAGHVWQYPFDEKQKQLGAFWSWFLYKAGLIVVGGLIAFAIAVTPGALTYIGSIAFKLLGAAVGVVLDLLKGVVAGVVGKPMEEVSSWLIWAGLFLGGASLLGSGQSSRRSPS